MRLLKHILWYWTGFEYLWDIYIKGLEKSEKPKIVLLLVQVGAIFFTMYGLYVGIKSLEQARKDTQISLIENKYGALIELYGSDELGLKSALKELPKVTLDSVNKNPYKPVVDRITNHVNEWLIQYQKTKTSISKFLFAELTVDSDNDNNDKGYYSLDISNGHIENKLILKGRLRGFHLTKMNEIGMLEFENVFAEDLNLVDNNYNEISFSGKLFCYNCTIDISITNKPGFDIYLIESFIDESFADFDNVFLLNCYSRNSKEIISDKGFDEEKLLTTLQRNVKKEGVKITNSDIEGLLQDLSEKNNLFKVLEFRNLVNLVDRDN